MTFRTLPQAGLPASSSPFRVVDDQNRELEWINRFLDMLCVLGTAPLTLRSYANQLLHFVRWWSKQPGVDVTRLALNSSPNLRSSTTCGPKPMNNPNPPRKTSTSDPACFGGCTVSISSKTCRMRPV